jgi:DNA-binding GntR family transcriptional regulator
LWIDILKDYKMCTMPNWLWRRTIELFLLAGESGFDGILPSVKDIAWRLRISPGKVDESLQALVKIGVVHQTPKGWQVTNFAKWQQSESLERVRRFRTRQQEFGKEKGYHNKVGNTTVAVEESSSAASFSFSDSPSDSVSEADRGVGEVGADE